MKKPTNEQIIAALRRKRLDPEVMCACEDLLSVCRAMDVTFGDVKCVAGRDRELARDVAKALMGAMGEAR